MRNRFSAMIEVDMHNRKTSCYSLYIGSRRQVSRSFLTYQRMCHLRSPTKPCQMMLGIPDPLLIQDTLSQSSLSTTIVLHSSRLHSAAISSTIGHDRCSSGMRSSISSLSLLSFSLQFDDHTQYTQRRFQSFDDHNKTEQDIAFSSDNSALVHYQNPHRQLNHTAASAAVQYFDSLPTIDLIDPMQAQFMYQTSPLNSSDAQNQISKYRILCNAKDKKITELENRCAQYHENYTSELRALKHKIELTDSKEDRHALRSSIISPRSSFSRSEV